MTSPAILLGFTIASLLGALYHLLRGGGTGRLLFYIALAWGGFWGGHFLGVLSGWMLWSVGPLRIGWGSLGALLVLLTGDWLRFGGAESS
jgi:dipeptide/tripeptide permease